MRHPGIEPGSPRVCVLLLYGKLDFGLHFLGKGILSRGFLSKERLLATRYSTDKLAAHKQKEI